MICVAKALSAASWPVGGVLVSAAVRAKVFDGMERGVRHGSTFGATTWRAPRRAWRRLGVDRRPAKGAWVISSLWFF